MIMGTTLYKEEYIKLINEDIERLEKDMKQCPERDHMKAVLLDSIEKNYPKKIIGAIGHVDHGNVAVHKSIAKLQKMGKEIVVIATDEINPRPRIIEREPFIIENLPVIEEPFFPRAKHLPKGHQRPYKYHR